MIGGVVFDIDGTILDSLEIWGDVGIRYLKQLGITVENEAVLSETLWPMTQEEGAAYLKEHYALTQSEAEIHRGIIQLIEDFYIYEVGMKSGVKDLLEFLHAKNIPMSLATTGEGRLAEAALRRLGVRDYFRELYTASELQTTKKEPLIFQKAAECLGVEPEKVWVAEDTCYALLTAKNAGFRTLAVYDKWGEENWEQMKREADFSIKSMHEFLKVCVRNL